MNKNKIPSINSRKTPLLSSSILIKDLKALLKAGVLAANVLPVFSGFWLALHFTNKSFMDNWEIFLLTMIGSTLVMGGALILNNWYDVDIDTIMERTKSRPTVTGNIPLNVVLAMGIVFTIIGFIFLLFTTFKNQEKDVGMGWLLQLLPR